MNEATRRSCPSRTTISYGDMVTHLRIAHRRRFSHKEIDRIAPVQRAWEAFHPDDKRP